MLCGSCLPSGFWLFCETCGQRNRRAEEGNRVTGIASAGRMFVAEGGAYPEDTVGNVSKSQVHFCSLQFKDTLQMQLVVTVSQNGYMASLFLSWCSCGPSLGKGR